MINLGGGMKGNLEKEAILRIVDWGRFGSLK